MKAAIQRTHSCAVCDGSCVDAATQGNCLACHGEGAVCRCCSQPVQLCDCTEADFRNLDSGGRFTREVIQEHVIDVYKSGPPQA
jgi:hypothetical protein